MRLSSLATLLGAAAVVTLTAWPADAQTRRQEIRAQRLEAYPGERVIRRGQRTRTRITVRPRSFLDPGTEVLPRSQSYTDYAVPPLYHPTRIWDFAGSHRYPLPDSYYLPGYTVE